MQVAKVVSMLPLFIRLRHSSHRFYRYFIRIQTDCCRFYFYGVRVSPYTVKFVSATVLYLLTLPQHL